MTSTLQTRNNLLPSSCTSGSWGQVRLPWIFYFIARFPPKRTLSSNLYLGAHFEGMLLLISRKKVLVQEQCWALGCSLLWVAKNGYPNLSTNWIICLSVQIYEKWMEFCWEEGSFCIWNWWKEWQCCWVPRICTIYPSSCWNTWIILEASVVNGGGESIPFAPLLHCQFC